MGTDPPAPLATFVRALVALEPDPAATRTILELLNLVEVPRKPPKPDPSTTTAASPAPPAPPPRPSRPRPATTRSAEVADRSGAPRSPARPFEVVAHGAASGSSGARPPRPFRPLATLLADPSVAPGEPEDLFPTGQRRAILGGLCASRRLEGDLDVDAVTERIGRGEVITTIPRRPVLTTRYGIELLVDVGEGMRPFGADVTRVRAAIERIVGRDNLDVQQFAGCPLEDPGAGPGPHWTWERYQPGASTRPALALSDLGLGGRPPGRPDLAQRWCDLADQLRGAGRRLVVLVPYPESRWPPAAIRSLALVAWDRRTDVGDVVRAVRSRQGR